MLTDKVVVSDGIIPALAGNTCRCLPNGYQDPDHPRSRGEYAGAIHAGLASTGSSPLSRGIRRIVHIIKDIGGIIPALAGNTCCLRSRISASTDHPRSRGEYLFPVNKTRAVRGSSPLSRGIRGLQVLGDVTVRIIPALAGNTLSATGQATLKVDHPRSRGEYESVRATVERLTARIIPALAGNTLADKGFYQLDLSDLGNPLLARLRFSKSLAPRLRRPPSWRGESSGSSPEGPGRTIRVSPS